MAGGDPAERTAPVPDAEYAAILRTSGVDIVEVARIYVTALTLIRQVLHLDLLPPEDKVSEIELIFSGLMRVQEDLDAREV